MEIERPFRILKVSQNEAEKASKNNTAEQNTEPIGVQLGQGLKDLERVVEAYRGSRMNPNNIERNCQEFEKNWSNRLEKEGEKHFIDGMKIAVDSIRNEEKPNLEFLNEKPEFKLTKDATRRMAQSRTRADNELEI